MTMNKQSVYKKLAICLRKPWPLNCHNAQQKLGSSQNDWDFCCGVGVVYPAIHRSLLCVFYTPDISLKARKTQSWRKASLHRTGPACVLKLKLTEKWDEWVQVVWENLEGLEHRLMWVFVPSTEFLYLKAAPMGWPEAFGCLWGLTWCKKPMSVLRNMMSLTHMFK